MSLFQLSLSRAVLSAVAWTALACWSAGCGDAAPSEPQEEPAQQAPAETTAPTPGDPTFQLRGRYEKVCGGGRWSPECLQNVRHHHSSW